MKWKQELLAEQEDHRYTTLQTRKWTDRRAHLLPADFLVNLRELEQQLELLGQRIQIQNDIWKKEKLLTVLFSKSNIPQSKKMRGFLPLLFIGRLAYLVDVSNVL